MARVVPLAPQHTKVMPQHKPEAIFLFEGTLSHSDDAALRGAFVLAAIGERLVSQETCVLIGRQLA